MCKAMPNTNVSKELYSKQNINQTTDLTGENEVPDIIYEEIE